MSLTADEVCVIIKACGEAGVMRLHFGDLKLSFDKSSKDTRPPVQFTWSGPGSSSPSLTPETPAAPEHERITKDTLEADELETRRAQIEDLLVTDPLMAEELISNGELGENEQDDGSEDDE